ncbi:hypothetical protein OSTOST_08474 [Ostertagia ostertagi]
MYGTTGWLFTILEIIGVFINVYCVVVVYMFMQRLAATTDEYEGKKPQVPAELFHLPANLVYQPVQRRMPEEIMKHSYPPQTTPMYQNYPPYSPSGMPQTPLPMPSSPYPPVPPYPVDDHEWSRHLIWPWFICIVSSILTSLAYCIMWWAGDVRDYWMALTILEIIGVFINVYCVVVVYMFMQRLAATTDEYEGKKPQVRYKVNRNGYTRKPLDDYRTMYQNYPPYSPSGMPQTPLPMPSSPYPPVPPYPVDDHEVSAFQSVFAPAKFHNSRLQYFISTLQPNFTLFGAHLSDDQEAVMPTTPPNPSLQNQPMVIKGDDGVEHDAPSPSSPRQPTAGIEPKKSHSDHHNRDRDDRRRRKERNGDDHRKRRHERDEYERNGRDDIVERTGERRSRRHEHRNGEASRLERPEKETSFDTVQTDATFPLSGGISIPQHIVIPPSMGERGPDGNPLPQKFQINSEITINYDGLNPTPQSDPNEPYRRRYPRVRYDREPKARFPEKEEDPVAHWVKDQQKIGAHPNDDREAVMPTTPPNPSLQVCITIRAGESHSDHHNRDRDDRRRRKERNGDDHRKRRHERDDYERNGRDDIVERTGERRSRRHEHRNGEASRLERPEKETSFDTVQDLMPIPLSGGISIPQHIVIPPSMGERGPDGNPLPQKFQINSEITINYDGLNSTPSPNPNGPYRGDIRLWVCSRMFEDAAASYPISHAQCMLPFQLAFNNLSSTHL